MLLYRLYIAHMKGGIFGNLQHNPTKNHAEPDAAPIYVRAA